MSRDAFEELARSYRARLHPRGARLAPRHRFRVLLVALAVMFVAGMALLGTARAAEFGGCWSSGVYCAGPSATITVGELNLAEQKFSGGVSPGIGYGVTWQPAKWYSTGLAAYLDFSVGGSKPNRARPALMLSFANYVRIGAALSITERTGQGMLAQWSLLFGIGSDIGSSMPAEVK